MPSSNTDLEVIQDKPEEENEKQPESQEPEELVPDEVKTALKAILENCEKEDEDIRLRYIKVWRQLQEYAKGIQDIYWDEGARDWRNFSDDSLNDTSEPSRNINIFRGHMESVVAALSIKPPSTECTPDDAEDDADIETAKAFTEIIDLIQKHNPSQLMLVKLLYILWTQGTVCAYNYYKNDPKYGTVQVPEKQERKIVHYDMYCQNCGTKIGTVKETKPTTPLRCGYCGLNLVPETTEYPETIVTITGYSEEPKGRAVFDFFGPLNVKIPFYARKQEDIGYLIFKLETHYAMLRSQFPDIADKIASGSGGNQDTYERSHRLSPEYLGSTPDYLNTVKCIWMRPWMYWSICDKDDQNDPHSAFSYLSKNYPEGAYCIYVEDELAAISDECLDNHWTISIDPLSDFIHGEPLGKSLLPVQEMRNDLVALAFQTIEYGIPENFADPKVLDFQKYGEESAKPGSYTPATPKPGQGLGDAFFQTSPAHLGAEVQTFGEQLDQDGQFVVGDFPSVFGGPSEGSKTAFEYNKSNAQALQRLSLTWNRVKNLWTNVMSKCAREFIEEMKDDEKNVKKENGKFINVWIRKESLTGRIGSIEPVTSEMLPQSWEQKWQLITNLLQMKDPAINSVLLAPENAEIMKQAVAMPDFWIPGEEDRNKQIGEIHDMIQGIPVTVDPDMDDHVVCMKIIRQWMVSPKGVALYKSNPTAYQAIVADFKGHEQALQQKQMQMSSPPQPQGA